MISTIRKILTYGWRHLGLKAAWKSYTFTKLINEWRKIRNVKIGNFAAPNPTILIIPPDPLLLTASRGDQAMLLAVIAEYKSRYENARYVIVTTGDEADKRSVDIGAIPCRIFFDSLQKDLSRIAAHDLTNCVLVGADVLDGSYDPFFSSYLLILTDILARRGVDCKITGFSFSKNPYSKLRIIFDETHKSIAYNIRDPESFKRFQQFTHARAKLVADVAFLIKPVTDSPNLDAIFNWIRDQRAVGRKVIGVNIHPLVLELNERTNIDKVVSGLATSISRIADKKSISVLFIEHDFRGPSADEHCLRPLHSLVRSHPGIHAFYPSHKLSAQELKGLSSLLDVVISGRMHLMIAALGAETPVFGINYKDKMEGLLNLFELGPQSFCSAQNLIDDPRHAQSKISSFIEQSSENKILVLKNLPKVKRMAQSTFNN